MGRFERENTAKKVKLVSHVFAVLASIGIIIIGLQLFSKTTGLDIFNINYSLSKLFSDDTKQENNKIASPTEFSQPSLKPIDAKQFAITEAQIKAAIYLQNHNSLPSIKLTPNGIMDEKKNEKKNSKFSLFDITSLRSFNNLFSQNQQLNNAKKLRQNGVLPIIKQAKLSKWAIGLSLTPGVSYRQLKYTNLDEIMTRKVGHVQYGFYQTKKERNERDKVLMKYSFGLDIIFRINAKLNLQSGLVYLNSGESILVKEITDESNSQTSLAGTGAENHYFFDGKPDFEAPIANNSDENVRFANNISYFELPVIFNYQIKSIDELTNIEIQAGASLTRLNFATAMVYNFYNNGYYLISGTSPEIFNKYGSNAIAGVIYNKYITNSIQLFANPQMKVGLTNIFDSQYNIKQHYFVSGIRVGMRINL